MIGHTIGKYRVIDRIGRGGMGTVYRATDDTLHRDVAIKILNAGLNDPEVARRFRAEAITVARLSHPGIATVYELFEHDGQWLMVMEFVRGMTLEALVEKTGVLSPDRAAELCLHALAALAHAHSLGVVHRDLKPANLMLTESGVVKVMDFGIARVSGTAHITTAGFMMGTPAYMAPEQVMGREIDSRVDLYAMGVVLYRLVSGSLPFKGESAFALAQSQVNDPPTPIGLVRGDLPPWVDQIVSRALEKDPQERFQSAAAFHDALSRCVSGREPTASYDPAAPTEVLGTPAYPMPTGMVRAGTAALPVALDENTVPLPTAPMRAPVASGWAVRAVAKVASWGREVKRLKGSNRAVMYVAGATTLLAIVVALTWNRVSPLPNSTATDTTTGATALVSSPAVSPAPPATASDGKTPATPPNTGANAASNAGTAATRGATGRPAGAPSSARGRAPLSTDIRSFPKQKLIVINGGKIDSSPDVVIMLAAGQISAAPAGAKPLRSMAFKTIAKATYVSGESPQFDEKLFRPPSGLKYPGRAFRGEGWLVLQNQSEYMVLRLDTDTDNVLKAFESSSGIKVVRTTPSK